MSGFVQSARSASRPLVWVESTAYAARRLAGDAVPWLDAAAVVAWQRKAQSLLGSDVVALAAEPMCTAWVGAHPALARAMAAKRRPGFALRTLLGDAGLRAHLLEVVHGLRASFGGLPLALRLPSPWLWSALLGVTIDEDEADAAAVAIADFLRVFGESGLDVLLLDEPFEAAAPALGLYQPVLNVAAYYRWEVGLSCGANACDLDAGGGLSFAIAPRAPAGMPAGLPLPPSFWSGAEASAPRPGDFFYAEIPRDVAPETVLDRLATLRGR